MIAWSGAGDFLYGDEGEDYIFGGVGNDEIHGGDDTDVLLGDHGKFDKTLPVEHRYESVFTSNAYLAGRDRIYGDGGDDMILGQQGSDWLYGGMGEDDITGGHDVLGGADDGDEISGDAGADVVLGDNGRIGRTALSWLPGPPCLNALRWKRWVDSNQDVVLLNNIMRTVKRFDDVDGVSGGDTINGGDGDDQLHGQRGDDTIRGGEGQDEIHGDQGDDKLYGDDGHDLIIGDVGHFVRSFLPDGTPRIDPLQEKWHTNIVLEEQAYVKSWLPTYETKTFTPAQALALVQTDLFVSLGAYQASGCKAAAGGNPLKPWETVLMGLQQVDSGDDEIHGGDGDDVLVGQRGNDKLFGDDGNDFLYGDSLTSAYHYDSALPLVARTIRLLPAGNVAPIAIAQFGTVFSAPLEVLPQQATRTGVLRVLEDAAVATVFGDDYLLMLGAVGAGDLTRTDTAAVTKMKPFSTIVPDAIRHKKQLYGNDELSGGAGNDVLVGDFAVNHALVDLHVPELVKLRESAATRWTDLQQRLTLLSTDLDTYQAQEGTLTNPTELHSGEDTLVGDSGDDTVVGDGLEAYVSVVYQEDMSDEDVEFAAKDMMLIFSDFEMVAVDMLHMFYEAHHAVVTYLVATQATAVLAPDYKLYLSNDKLDGKDGHDVITGDTHVIVYKGINGLTRTHLDGRYFHGHTFSFPYAALLQDLQSFTHRHIANFNPSPPVVQQVLRMRQHWDSLPWTRFGNDEASGGDGDDSITGDFALVAVTSFAGAPFHHETSDGRRHIGAAQDAHLTHVSELLRDRLVSPAHKNNPCRHSGDGFNWASHLACYYEKGNQHNMAEPPSHSMSDTLRGEDGNDLLAGTNAVAALALWQPTKTVIAHEHVSPSTQFHKTLARNTWKWMHNVWLSDKFLFDANHLFGGPGNDLIVADNGHTVATAPTSQGAATTHRLANVMQQHAPSASEILGNAHARASQGTCLQAFADDGVVEKGSPLLPSSARSHVYWWPGAFGVAKREWENNSAHGPHVHHYHSTFDANHVHDPSDIAHGHGAFPAICAFHIPGGN